MRMLPSWSMRDPDRIVELSVDGRAAVLREREALRYVAGDARTGNGRDRAVRDAAHPVARVDDEDAARRVGRDAGGPVELRERRRAAIAQVPRDAASGDQADRRRRERGRGRARGASPSRSPRSFARWTSCDPLGRCGADPRSPPGRGRSAIVHPASDRCHPSPGAPGTRTLDLLRGSGPMTGRDQHKTEGVDRRRVEPPVVLSGNSSSSVAASRPARSASRTRRNG